jgi:hypothetical protein
MNNLDQKKAEKKYSFIKKAIMSSFKKTIIIFVFSLSLFVSKDFEISVKIFKDIFYSLMSSAISFIFFIFIDYVFDLKKMDE